MIYRIDVRTTPLARGGAAAVDPVGEAVRHQIQEFGADVGPIETTRIFLVDADATADQVRHAAGGLLADPVVETAESVPETNDGGSRIEIHLKPGVMDPVAHSTAAALADLGLAVRQVRTGRAYTFAKPIPPEQLRHIADRVLANGVIESVHFDRHLPFEFEVGRVTPFELRHVSVRELDDEQLKRLSRDGHLFLSLDEMLAVRDYYRHAGREPTDVELETIAQTWSEHCVHKTLKSAVEVEERDAAGNVMGRRRYANLIKETIFGSTVELMAAEREPFCLSVFKDNAGVIAFDETDAVCFKAETHNHPSAIEPYGGSATGVGGVIRDVLGTGLGAKPIANTDVFCVAHPQQGQLPRGVIHPKRVLQQVVAGVRDYGNRMGIPTVNGAVYFDDRYVGNPLVFCGCVGVIPRDKIDKRVGAGDRIVVLGGRTGRDGIHGATFSSAELTDTHADEFSHAVQIGNAITEKKVADVILQARDAGLFTAVTDCGAGGLSSAVGEMGEAVGADVQLDKVPLKYAGLRYDEIWISEAQERMVLSVPADRVDALLAMAAAEDVEATVIGTFGTPDRELVLSYNGVEVGRVAMAFLHDGIPMPTRSAVVVRAPAPLLPAGDGLAHDFTARLLRTLAHPNVAQQALGDPPVRPRGAGRQCDQTAGRPAANRAERRQRGPAEADEPPRRGHRLRADAVGGRPVRHGRGRDRRGRAQRRVRRCRLQPDGPARQLLLAERGRRADDGHARGGVRGVPRRGPGIPHPVRLGQGLAAQPVHRHRDRPGDPHPADAADLGHRHRGRRAAVRDDGPEAADGPRLPRVGQESARVVVAGRDGPAAVGRHHLGRRGRLPRRQRRRRRRRGGRDVHRLGPGAHRRGRTPDWRGGLRRAAGAVLGRAVGGDVD